MDSAAGSKRTRSQTTLDAFVSVNLARSPLKHARSALRHHSPKHSPPYPPAAQPAAPPTATDAPESSHADGQLKRPPSPAKDAALSHERDAKRPRHDIFPTKPSASLPALPNDARPHQPSSANRRAVSVPPISSAVPLLDLNNVPPSPRRSPTKFRIASVPPEQPPSPPPHPPSLTLDLVPPIPASEDAPSRSPLSPLSPLPQTEDESTPLDPLPDPSTSAADKPSRLPAPTLISRMKPKQAPPPKKPRHPRSSKSVAPAVRMTRSASLRQKKVEEEAKIKANTSTGPAATPLRRRSMSLSSYAQPTAASAAKASPVKPASSRPSTGVPSSSTFSFTSTLTPRISKAGSSANGVMNARPSIGFPHGEARPQSSASAEATAASNDAQGRLNSSLSTLNQALERLNAPPPPRPNTSMGFHPDHPVGADEDEAGDRAALRSSDGVSTRPGSTLPETETRTGAKGKGKVPLVPSAPAQTTAAGPSSSRAQPQAKKALRQTTLMLPPALPAPDKVRAGTRGGTETTGATALRQDGTAGGASGHAAGSSDEARKRQLGLALAPSLEKVRNSLGLGFALPSSGTPDGTQPTPSGAAGAGSRSNTARPTPAPTTGAATKRIFPVATSSNGRALFAGLGVGGSGDARPGASSLLRAPRAGFGLGASRVVQRVSKKSSLPVVIGSPVKGGQREDVGEADEAIEMGDQQEGSSATSAEPGASDEGGERTTQERIGDWLKNASTDLLRDLGHTDDSQDAGADGAAASSDGTGGPPALADADIPSSSKDAPAVTDEDKERERERKRNASRRASLASHLLTQSLSALPDTPPRMAEDSKGKGRAVSSSWPAPKASESGQGPDGERAGVGESGEGSREMPPPPVPPPRPTRHSTRLATGALSTPPGAGSSRTGATGSEKDKGKERAKGESPSALAVLRGCTIFVDVRTEEGDDAGGLFVDMLKGLGAKMATRVGSRCTHVVYKNGLMSTLTRYRLLKDPKPLVVGIAWVVECAEQRARVDETRFLVNLEMANVAGINKRRRSMLPKNVFESPGSEAKTGGVASPASSDSSFRTNAPHTHIGLNGYAKSRAGDRSMDISSPTSMAADEDGDSSMQSNLGGSSVLPQGPDDEESLPPLEKARRRRSMLPAR